MLTPLGSQVPPHRLITSAEREITASITAALLNNLTPAQAGISCSNNHTTPPPSVLSKSQNQILKYSSSAAEALEALETLAMLAAEAPGESCITTFKPLHQAAIGDGGHRLDGIVRRGRCL